MKNWQTPSRHATRLKQSEAAYQADYAVARSENWRSEDVGQSSLMSKVNLLLCVSLLLGAAGTEIGLHTNGTVAGYCWLTGFVTIIILYFGSLLNRVQFKEPSIAIAMMCLFVSTFSVSFGYFTVPYIHILGQATVVCTYLGTAGFAALCLGVVALCRADFRRWEVPLYFALAALYFVGILAWLHGSYSNIQISYCIGGIVIFTGFFLVDLSRYLRSAENTWAEAVDITINLYLDYVNFVLYTLRLLTALKK